MLFNIKNVKKELTKDKRKKPKHILPSFMCNCLNIFLLRFDKSLLSLINTEEQILISQIYSLMVKSNNFCASENWNVFEKVLLKWAIRRNHFMNDDKNTFINEQGKYKVIINLKNKSSKSIKSIKNEKVKKTEKPNKSK